MKKAVLILVTLFMVAALISCASTVTVNQKNASPELLKMETIVDVEGKNQNDLYVSANEWAVRTFNKATSVIEFSDKESGRIAGKYVTSIRFGLADMLVAEVKTTMIIEVRDGRYRAVLSDPYYEIKDTHATGSGSLRDTSALSIVRAEWSALLASLEEAMKSKPTSW